MAFRIGLVKLGKELESSSGRVCGGKTGQGFVRTCVLLRLDRMTRGPNGRAEMIHHGDHEGTI